MRILIVSTHDSRGGAGKAAYRFAKEFINQGHDVCLYVRESKEKDAFIKISNTPKIVFKLFHILDFVPGYILSGFNKEPQFTLGLFGESLEKIVKEFNPDIINIHWSWKGFISFPEICRISKTVPVVWTMHDYSPFASGVFYPYLDNIHFPLVKMLAGFNSKIRRNCFKNSDIYFVSPSEFLEKEFKRLSNFNCKNIKTINNGVDCDIFHKLDENKSREKYGLEIGKKYILFGAINFLDNEVKGGTNLVKALQSMKEYLIKNNIGIVSFGSQDPSGYISLDDKIEHKFVGYIQSDHEMTELLSTSNVMLVPSRQENYPFVVLEALACGIPVIAFRVGGIPEMIEHKKNGYLVNPFVINEYIEGMKYVLENPLKMDERERFDIRRHAEEYVKLFKKVLTD